MDLQGQPQQEWDYFAARDDQGLSSGRKALSQDWSIGTNYRAELVETKDLMMLWISGREDPGVHQLGVVSGSIVEAEVVKLDEASGSDFQAAGS